MPEVARIAFSIMWIVAGVLITAFNYNWVTMFQTIVESTGSPLMILMFWIGLIIGWLSVVLVIPVIWIRNAFDD